MKYGFAKRVNHMQSSAVRDILKVVNRGDVISFAGGLPDEKLFPVEEVKQAFNQALSADPKALQYGETEGVFALREQLSERMAQKNIYRDPSNILITSGSQQAIDLFARVMFNPGDIILTEDPTYLAALQVFNSYEVKVVPVEADEHGMLKEDLEEKIQRLKPKCIYVVPTYSNPEGKVWSLERRKLLLQLAEKYHTLIFEDDPYGDLRFDDDDVPPISSLDDNKYVMYTSTFSKTVVPAMRTGWIAGPYQIIRMMSQAKQATDLHTNSLAQHALVHLLNDFDLDEHIQTLRTVYKERMLVMKDIFDRGGEELPIRYKVPKGGMFFWVAMPEHVNTTELLQKAVENGVAFVPGAPFYVENPKQHTLRLNFTNAEPEVIETGMKRLVEVMEKPTADILD